MNCNVDENYGARCDGGDAVGAAADDDVGFDEVAGNILVNESVHWSLNRRTIDAHSVTSSNKKHHLKKK